MTLATEAAARTSPAAARALRVLETLAADAGGGLTLAELRRRLGFSHGNLHAILATMEAAGHVRRDGDSRAYTLGPALLVIGDAARRTYPSVEVAAPFMGALAEELDTECRAGLRAGDEILVVARVGPRPPLGFGVDVGERFPLRPPVGVAYLAWSSAAEIEAYLRAATGHLSTIEIDRLAEAMAGVRRQGYLIHVESGARQRFSETAVRIVNEATKEGYEEELLALVGELGHHEYVLMETSGIDVGNVVAVSGPALGPDGEVALVIGVSFVAPRMAARPLAEVAERLLATLADVTRALSRPRGLGPIRG